MTGVRSEFERARNVVEPFFLLTLYVMSNVLARWALLKPPLSFSSLGLCTALHIPC